MSTSTRESEEREKDKERRDGGYENILKRGGAIQLDVDDHYGIEIDDQNHQRCHVNGRETTFHELILSKPLGSTCTQSVLEFMYATIGPRVPTWPVTRPPSASLGPQLYSGSKEAQKVIMLDTD